MPSPTTILPTNAASPSKMHNPIATPLPRSRIATETSATDLGIDAPTAFKAFVKWIQELTGFRPRELTRIPHAKNVKVPTLVAQIRNDALIDTKDTLEIYDNFGFKEKELIWIEGMTRRFDGCNYFGENPNEMLAWLEKYVR
ncbi:hypothetical protein K431DRAFT_295515 [Polychaeton citri CBS 116435]|uniref:Uncharacterized protein n=1 Tax=Polychaeton citri CBS 116435 TaxID=1314669 RepID=A0A9P4Q7Q9_9PEZI|nr:hypothetical protein K431DRAFT_295515 [Polychaeton citri CBS 116435]